MVALLHFFRLRGSTTQVLDDFASFFLSGFIAWPMCGLADLEFMSFWFAHVDDVALILEGNMSFTFVGSSYDSFLKETSTIFPIAFLGFIN